MLKKCRAIVFIVTLSAAFSTHAEKWCFTIAQTYYEQLYCEIKAKGLGTRLPAFYEFKRNNAMTQALLLKGYARQTGIAIVIPSRAKKNRQQFLTNPDSALPSRLTKNTGQSLTAPGQSSPDIKLENNTGKRFVTGAHNLTPLTTLTHCNTNKLTITCGNRHYQLVANQHNAQLSRGVFSAKNTLDLPVFRGSLTDKYAVNHYLTESYRRYLKKMLSIGLGGATLSYGKFSYLFSDLTERNISFSDRFETMYFYLKKDKKSIAVNTKITSPDKLSLQDCSALDNMLVCAAGTKNYLYLPATK